MAYGLSTNELRTVAFEMAKVNNLKFPEAWLKEEKAGKTWMECFLKRCENISIRKPEACSLARLTSFNKHNVAAFFNNLETILMTTKLPANRIFNLDESGLTTVQVPHRVLAEKGCKQLNQATSSERGELVTICVVISAAGAHIPQ